MSELALMCVGEQAAPVIYVDQDGVWQEPPPLTPTSGADITELKASLDAVLKDVMDAGGRLPLVVEGLSRTLYRALVPPSLRQRLRATAEADEAPVLRVHVHKNWDWIPWELLHDGTGYLGLRFKVARLPIVAKPPDLSARDNHPLRRVRSILGADVVQSPADGEFEQWRDTFLGLLPQAAEQCRLPAAELDDGEWPTTDVFNELQEDDIVHFTCHGAIKNGEPCWTLKPGVPEFWKYDVTPLTLTNVSLTRRTPLVFGNACKSGASDAGLLPGLASQLFGLGALNVVATFAPITQTLALEFARLFYERLLGSNGAPGTTIADALWATKKHYFDADTDDPSYLFYCLYGPPDTRFAT